MSAQTTATAANAAPVVVPAPNRKRAISLTVAAIVVLSATSYWVYQRGFEDTDDAQIDANISDISSRVTGTVKTVLVVENQRVKAGDVLAELDTSDLDLALLQAKAQVAQAEAQLKSESPNVGITERANKTLVTSTGSDLASAQAGLAQAQQQVAQIGAQLAQAQANDKTAQTDRSRAANLVKSGSVSQADFDARDNAATASSANVAALTAALGAAHAAVAEQNARLLALHSRVSEATENAPRQLEAREASVAWRTASLDLAKAQLAQAELNLTYAKVIAPVSGVIGKKSMAVGDHVQPGQQLVAIAQIDSLWVTANFRETQLQRMHAGQHVKLHIDAIDSDLDGTVESFGGATGSRFSVLPPENASGNYVKVVQRIPVRIHLETTDRNVLDRLRPGMSVEPVVTLK